MFCTKCGNEIAKDSTFCNKCGAVIDDSAKHTSDQHQTGGQGQKRPEKKKVRKTAIAAIAALIVIVIAAALIISLVVLPARKDAKRAEARLSTINSSVQVGDTVLFGEYEQDGDTANGAEDIEWRILTIEGNRALLISVHSLERRQFNANRADGADWESSDLRAWLIGDFADEAFARNERSMLNTDPFCLSVSQAREYFSSNTDRICITTYWMDGPEADWFHWWLRSPADDPSMAALVASNGRVATNGAEVDEFMAVRPAVWVNLR